MKLTKRLILFFYVSLTWIVYGSKPTSYAQEQKDSLSYYSQLALKPQSPDDLDKAYNYFNLSREIAIKQKDIPREIHDLYYLSSIDYKRGAYEDCEQASVDAIALLDEHPEVPNTVQLQTSFYTLLGMLYSQQRNIDKSLELYNKVLKITQRSSDSAIVYNNISNVHKKNNQPEKAKEALTKAFAITPRIKDPLITALISDNLGFAHTKLGNSQKGLDLMKTALQLRSAAKDTSTLYKSYSHLSTYYYSIDSIEVSKAYALKALELAKSINSATYLRDALGVLTTLSNDSYSKAYKVLNDSLYYADKERLNANALLKYDYSEYKQKALQSQLDKKQQEIKTIVAVSATGFVFLIGLFLYIILKAKHKKEKLQQVYTTEARISEKLHDEVANDVYHVMAKIQSAPEPNDLVLDDLEKIYNRTRDISKETSAVDLDNDFNMVINDLLLSYKTEDVNVITKNNSKIDWEVLSDIKKITVYRVLQELMTNMRKHSKASIVVLSFNQLHKKITISYTDNGVGSSAIKNNGLQNAENRIKAIKGSFTFDSKVNKGFKAQIRV